MPIIDVKLLPFLPWMRSASANSCASVISPGLSVFSPRAPGSRAPGRLIHHFSTSQLTQFGSTKTLVNRLFSAFSINESTPGKSRMSTNELVIGLMDTECSGIPTNDMRSFCRYGPPLRLVQKSPMRNLPAMRSLETYTRSGTGTANLAPPTLALSVICICSVCHTRSHSKMVSPSFPRQHRDELILGAASPSLNVVISNFSKYDGRTLSSTLVRMRVSKRLSQNSIQPSQKDFKTSDHQSAVSEPSGCSLAYPRLPWNFFSSSARARWSTHFRCLWSTTDR
mmetsp:Transcript_11585/g.32182  ORF Transcript_11585/g.32182 Transcript_11585/m.32182 type:complete len:282 (-) Transcript_11585:1000-1845(-)